MVFPVAVLFSSHASNVRMREEGWRGGTGGGKRRNERSQENVKQHSVLGQISSIPYEGNNGMRNRDRN